MTNGRGSSKVVVLISLGLGIGLAVVASGLSGISWYASRQWDSNALHATLDHVGLGAHNQLLFYYKVENRTDSRYDVSRTSPVELIAKFKRASWFSLDHRSLQLTEPFSIPARQQGLVVIPFGKVSSSVCPIGSERDNTAKMISLARTAYPKLAGFVLYDRENRYQIAFPGIVEGQR